MYGLKQGALLAFETLETLLLDAGYVPILGSTGMWKHSTRPTIFCLCVNNFGVKYFSCDDALHLQRTLESVYTAKMD